MLLPTIRTEKCQLIPRARRALRLRPALLVQCNGPTVHGHGDVHSPYWTLPLAQSSAQRRSARCCPRCRPRSLLVRRRGVKQLKGRWAQGPAHQDGSVSSEDDSAVSEGGQRLGQVEGRRMSTSSADSAAEAGSIVIVRL